MPDYSKKIVYLSEAQYQELISNQTITVNGTTVTYDANTIYMTPQNVPLYPSDISAWAKAANKPSYTASEVGAASENVIAVQDSTPTDPGTKIWVQPNASDSVRVPTVDDMNTALDDKADKADTVLDTTLSRGRKANTTVGTGSFAFGTDVEASAQYSHAEGSSTIASGSYSHAEGGGTTASGYFSHAEGSGTRASGQYSHAEGGGTIADNGNAHAEGGGTKALGYVSHSEGAATEARGNYSHSEGLNTIAQGASQHVFGKYNISDVTSDSTDTSLEGQYVEIVGNGNSNTRSNARTLDWNGNEELAGDLTVNKGTANEISVSDLNGDVDDLKTEIEDKLDAPAIPGTSGQVLTSDGQGGQSWQTPGGWDVTDVQVNGTSVVTNGVANVPMANNDGRLGVSFADPSNGINIYSTGKLYINPASSTDIKNGTNERKPIVPLRQHESTFYGLAKAAGDTTQSQSSNAVGTYTDDALVKIQKMLGLYREWELIADVTTTENLESVTVDTDSSGQPFELRKMCAIVVAGPTTTGTRDNVRQQFKYVNMTNVSTTGSLPACQYGSATSSIYIRSEVEIDPVVPAFVRSVTSGGTTNSGVIYSSPIPSTNGKKITGYKIFQYNATSTLIPSGTNIKIYGIRV